MRANTHTCTHTNKNKHPRTSIVDSSAIKYYQQDITGLILLILLAYKHHWINLKLR